MIIKVYVDDGFVEEGAFADYETEKIDQMILSEKRIYLRPGVREYHPVEDIYKEVRFIRRQDVSLRVMQVPVTADGNVAKGGGRFTPRYAVFRNGWRVVPANETHDLLVSGEQITDDGQSGLAVIDRLPIDPENKVGIEYTPPAAEVIVINGGAGLTLAEIEASAVLAKEATAQKAAKAAAAALALSA
jgi:hypothetical protein